MVGEAPRELATTRALEALPGGAWREMHEVRCASRRLSNIDHVVVGRAGVFVIDSRDWSDDIEVSSEGLSQDGFTREATLSRLVDAASAVAELVPELERRHVVPVLCFDHDEPVSEWVGGVLVCTSANVVELLLAQRRILESSRLEELFNRVAWALPSASYRVGEPSGPSQNGHRLDGRARTRLVPRRRSAKHVPSTPDRSSAVVRAALAVVLCALVVCFLVRYLAGPVVS